MYKAGHHGSNTSSSPEFLSVIKPKIVVVTCVAGSVEYTQNLKNTFPTQNFIENVSKFTDKVYVTSYIDVELNAEGKYENKGEYKLLNGNIVISSKAGSDIELNFSNNNFPLKETTWFKNNREAVSSWQ